MAVEFITAVWELSPYSAEKLLVQLALADWSNLAGEIYPSHTEIARKARISKRGSIAIIQQMINDGELEKLEKGVGAGHRNRYRFSEKYRRAVTEISQDWANKRAEKASEKGASGSPFPAQKGEPVSPIKGAADSPLIAFPSTRKVKEKAKKVKQDVSHIRKNRHEPSKNTGALAPGSLSAQECHDLFLQLRHDLGGYEAPYQSKAADFVRLNELLKKSAAANWPITPARFSQAATNYFASPQGSHTLADLAVRFSTFYKSPLNEYGKPVKAVVNGNGHHSSGYTPKKTAADPNCLKCSGSSYRLSVPGDIHSPMIPCECTGAKTNGG